jgi:dUTP pyrophosphatase
MNLQTAPNKDISTKSSSATSLDQPVCVPISMDKGSFKPIYASKEAAGADVCAYITEEKMLKPGERALVPTGIRFEIPAGYEIQVRPRSGLAYKHGITVLNTPGTIDSDYRGELGILLINHGQEPFLITPNMRIAQIILAPVCRAEFLLHTDLSATERGSGGFGHTGTH